MHLYNVSTRGISQHQESTSDKIKTILSKYFFTAPQEKLTLVSVQSFLTHEDMVTLSDFSEGPTKAHQIDLSCYALRVHQVKPNQLRT